MSQRRHPHAPDDAGGSGSPSGHGEAGDGGRGEKPSGASDAEGKPTGGKAAARKGFLLRLPPSLLAELRGWANQDLRSLNGHIEFLLREALKRRKGGDGDP